MNLAPAPGMHTPWLRAVEAQRAAATTIDICLKLGTNDVLKIRSQWELDGVLLHAATPFAWSRDPIAATLAASRSLPLDTPFNAWNLNTSAAWWWFEDPLPFQTINTAGDEHRNQVDATTAYVRALVFGWVEVQPTMMKIPAGSPTDVLERALREGPPVTRVLTISAWLDDPVGIYPIIPSQTQSFQENETLADMLTRVRRGHRALYGPGGPLKDTPQVGEDVYMAAVEGIARFILAGMAWLDQRILSEGPVERHARKQSVRDHGVDVSDVKVISLRRVERKRSESGTVKTVDWSCQWEVDGHWRHQACGAGMKDHKTVWISSHRKGPDDKPFRVPTRKVYRVMR